MCPLKITSMLQCLTHSTLSRHWEATTLPLANTQANTLANTQDITQANTLANTQATTQATTLANTQDNILASHLTHQLDRPVSKNSYTF